MADQAGRGGPRPEHPNRLPPRGGAARPRRRARAGGPCPAERHRGTAADRPELHDVLGHTVSLINVQSGAAPHRLAKRPTPRAP
ncbi:histidine kinase [Streptomyces sp. NE5-10]|uniref:histidine kinase n=1 Tax=Streptomyces sp. NE5-10 TaxID=2759674 RepID=UPI00241337E3